VSSEETLARAEKLLEKVEAALAVAKDV